MNGLGGNDITFQVTLPSGAVATNPTERAALIKTVDASLGPIITNDGRVLAPPKKDRQQGEASAVHSRKQRR